VSEDGFVGIELDGDVAWVTIDNPPVNALSRTVLLDLGRAADLLDADDRVRSVVLSGAGRAFAAGGDVHELAAVDAAAAPSYAREVQAAVRALATCGKPVIAAVHGFALGGGTEVALCCDLRLAARGAHFGLPEVQLGLIPGTGATARLARVVGPGRAKELILSGRVIDAEEALAIGLVDELVDREDMRDRARELAYRFSTSSPDAVRAAKRLVDHGLEPLLEAESAAFADLLCGPDAAVGLASFVEHGRPGRADFRPAPAEA
jgi:enoyl-CoA hydratase/carnithine racemase